MYAHRLADDQPFRADRHRDGVSAGNDACGPADRARPCALYVDCEHRNLRLLLRPTPLHVAGRRSSLYGDVRCDAGGRTHHCRSGIGCSPSDGCRRRPGGKDGHAVCHDTRIGDYTRRSRDGRDCAAAYRRRLPVQRHGAGQRWPGRFRTARTRANGPGKPRDMPLGSAASKAGGSGIRGIWQ